MLTRLHIENFALISEITLELEDGLTVLTGETGSGKSILLGALGLVIGERGNVSNIRQGANLCVVEAVFSDKTISKSLTHLDIESRGSEIYIRREINSTGRSRAFINDSQVSIVDLKSLGRLLVDLHGQDETRALLDRVSRLQLLDSFGGHEKIFKAYKLSFESFCTAKEKLKKLEIEASTPRADKNYLAFQLEELGGLNLKHLNYAELDAEYNELLHATELANGLHTTYELLDSSTEGNDANSIIDIVLRTLEDLSEYSVKASKLKDRLSSSRIELNDIAQEANNIADGISQDPNRLLIVKEKMEALSTALHKHSVSDTESLKLVEIDLQNQLDRCDGLAKEIQLAKDEKTAQFNNMISSGEKLLESRKKSGADLLEIVNTKLVPLKLPDVVMSWEFAKLPSPDSQGIEDVELLFSANPGSDPQPLASVASGGERSRIMLAFKATLGTRKTAPTIVLDEIDTGVSGEVATRMATTMLNMAKTQQVFSVTHLAQIAAKGNNHIEISKEPTEKTAITRAQYLSKAERNEAIATLLSGNKISEEARAAADVLLNS
ncbi:MAG: DNA repair protein RecN [Flavobacteriales bacterium]|nr:DNA repair protein RecN [Flavobacteriales bacterium]